MTSTSQHQNWSYHFVPHRVFCGLHACFAPQVIIFSAPFSRAASHSALLYLSCAMESPTSCVSTASSSDESFAHNMWNPLIELLFHVQIGSIFEQLVDGTDDLARTALSCHYSVTKKELTLPHDAQAGTTARCQYPLWFGTSVTLVTPTRCAKQTGLRWSLPVLDRSLYLAGCRIQGLVHVWTKCFNEYGLEDFINTIEDTIKKPNCQCHP